MKFRVSGMLAAAAIGVAAFVSSHASAADTKAAVYTRPAAGPASAQVTTALYTGDSAPVTQVNWRRRGYYRPYYYGSYYRPYYGYRPYYSYRPYYYGYSYPTYYTSYYGYGYPYYGYGYGWGPRAYYGWGW